MLLPGLHDVNISIVSTNRGWGLGLFVDEGAPLASLLAFVTPHGLRLLVSSLLGVSLDILATS